VKICAGAFSFIVAVAVLSGCASRPPRVIDQPIGPLDANASSAGNGTLVVYSGQESFNGDPEYLVHTSYTILDPAGAVLRKVDNRGPVADRDPSQVLLPAGRYKVLAEDSYYGVVSLMADIQAGRKTVIDLNEEQFPPRARGDQWVRLPSGQIVGAKSR
jgi:hypothetical protein